MPQLTATQVAQYGYAAGWRTVEELATAVAIAKRESNFNTNAHNAKPPDDSYGLWQINMLGSLGPDRRRRAGLSSNADLFDPATNARVAHMIYREVGSWRPWSTYRGLVVTSEARGAAQAVVLAGGGGPELGATQVGFDPIGGAKDALGAAGGIVGGLVPGGDQLAAVGRFAQALTSKATWVRILKILGGLALAGLGLVVVFRDSVATAVAGAAGGPAAAAAVQGAT